MDKKEIKNILIIRPDAIGDCVLITPAIKALKQRFPEAKISVLAQALTRDIFSANPNVEEVLTDLKDIRSRHYDFSIHYYNEMPYAWAALHAGIKYRLGDPSKFPVGLLYNLKFRQNWRDITKHDVEQNMLLLKPLGIEPPYPKLELHVDQKALEKVNALLLEHGISPGDKIAGLHLSTGKGNKPWKAENFGKIAAYLSQKGFKVVAAGQAKDKELIQQAQKSANNSIIDLSMQTDLKELIALTSKYELFVGVDTGPFHIAAALGIPMVHISTSKFSLPLRWGPWQDRHVLVRKKSACPLFCLPADCKETICTDEITPSEVIAAIEELLSGGGNQTQEQAFYDWCRKCFNIMITYRAKNAARAEAVHNILQSAGFYSTMIDIDKRQDYPALFKKENTNIIHAVDGSPWLRFQAMLSGRSLITPALYINDRPGYNKASEFFDLYCRSFAESKI